MGEIRASWYYRRRSTLPGLRRAEVASATQAGATGPDAPQPRKLLMQSPFVFMQSPFVFIRVNSWLSLDGNRPTA